MISALHVSVLLLVVAATSHCRVIVDSEDGDDPSSARLSLWATRAHDWLLGEACASTASPDGDVDSAPAPSCRDLVRVPRAQIRLYAAGRGLGAESELEEAVLVTLVGPEGGRPLGPHDAVLVLDPYPDASFGHLVLVFFVALGTTEERCMRVGGLRLGNGDCIQPARQPRCSPGAADDGPAPAPCELLFLPLATPASRPPAQRHDSLQCRNHVAGFSSAPCPQLRPLAQVSQLRCDPNRCDAAAFVRTRCPFMQTCDHAVILSGGWNRHLSDYGRLRNVLDFHAMLKHVGFHEDNIKVFFANGFAPDRGQEGPTGVELVQAAKLAMRHHVLRLCETARCADTLLLYLNGPAVPGGSTLLWDADGNGQMDEAEVYSARELLRDLSHCGARRVVVLADQSYAADLVRHAAHVHQASRALRNVAVLAGSAPTDPRHRLVCLADLARTEAVQAETVFLGSASLLNTTLAGMPCGLARALPAMPPREQRVLVHRYSGCQNLSTREWMAAQDEPSDVQDDEEQDDDDDDDQVQRSRSENNA